MTTNRRHDLTGTPRRRACFFCPPFFFLFCKLSSCQLYSARPMHHFIRVAARPLSVCSSGSRSYFIFSELHGITYCGTRNRGVCHMAVGKTAESPCKEGKRTAKCVWIESFFLTLLCVGERSVVHTQSPQLGRDVDRMWRVCFPPWIQREPLWVLLSENGHCVYKVPFTPVPALETQALAQSCCIQESFLSRLQWRHCDMEWMLQWRCPMSLQNCKADGKCS